VAGARIDINVDMGEGYGRWRLGDDAAVLPWITSANIACGFHAGDPAIMRQTVRLALEHDVAIGAHVGLPDLLGFGRREMAVSSDDVRDYAAYQIGALAAIAAGEGARLAHVKAHGALYALCSREPAHAAALAAAAADVDPPLPVFLASTTVQPAVQASGAPFVLEGFPDLEYRADGTIVIEPVKRAWEPARVARRAVRLAREGRIDTTDATDVELQPATLCLHGDAPDAAKVAQAVRRALEENSITVRRPCASKTQHSLSSGRQ
jgi:5-oxoprolinase (ATP-hydrolysing) subunit A